MKTLVLGASGATGRLVVKQLADRGFDLKTVTRNGADGTRRIPEGNNIEVIHGDISGFSPSRFEELLKDCGSVVSCLGHNTNIKGILGKPHRLVLDVVKNVAMTLNSSKECKKFILMSTTAFTDKLHGEKETLAESAILGIIRLLMPPHADNVSSGNYLFNTIGESEKFEWIAVRPDTLIDRESVTEYIVTGCRMRSPLFDPGKTSRINAASFMADLLTDDKKWKEWRFRAPVIYNKD